MARDGLFFRSLAAVHPRFRTPARSLWAQSGWAIVLTASGTYEQLYTYVVFAAVLFHVATGAAVFTLRRKLPDLPRPYRAWVPGALHRRLARPGRQHAVGEAGRVALGLGIDDLNGRRILHTLWEKPVESLWGLSLVALGLPAYTWWRRRRSGTSSTGPLNELLACVL